MSIMTLTVDPWAEALDARFFLGRMKGLVRLAAVLALGCVLAIALWWQLYDLPAARKMLVLCSLSFAGTMGLAVFALLAMGFYREACRVWDAMVKAHAPRWRPRLAAQAPEFAAAKLTGLRADLTVAALRSLNLKLKKLDGQWRRMVEREARLKARWDAAATMPYAWAGLFCPTAERQRLKENFLGLAGYYRAEVHNLHRDMDDLLEKRTALLQAAAAL